MNPMSELHPHSKESELVDKKTKVKGKKKNVFTGRDRKNNRVQKVREQHHLGRHFQLYVQEKRQAEVDITDMK